MLIGDQAWPVPISLVKSGERWRFATEEGLDERVNRRIGANERSAIVVLRAYIDAQKEYAARDRNADGVLKACSSTRSGAYNYVINGPMIAGFAMVAYPAQYGESGVMTFIVSHNGRVFEKDVGKNSTALGAKMTTFDPGTGWKEVPAP